MFALHINSMQDVHVNSSGRVFINGVDILQLEEQQRQIIYLLRDLNNTVPDLEFLQGVDLAGRGLESFTFRFSRAIRGDVNL